MSQISLRKIAKSFGDTTVLNDVSLDIEGGEFVTLVGPSGCGKSTLLRILAGLEAADAGQVEIQGRNVTAIRPADRNLAMVFQSYALYPHLTVAQNMMTPLRMRDLDRVGRLPVLGPVLSRTAYRKMRDRVADVAETLQIKALLDRKPGQLSGGQRQRVALGRAMVRQPVAFLMDEPLSNLDAALRVHMRAELSELHRRLGATFVYVTHDQAEALTMSDRMAVMMHGDILQVGPPNEVYLNPVSLDVARFIGSPQINTLPGEVNSAGGLALLGVTTEARSTSVRQAVTVGLRPEHLSMRMAGRFAGTVRHIENLGADIFLHLEVGGAPAPVVLRLSPAEASGIGLGASVNFDFEPGKMLLFDENGARLSLTQTAREVA
ncbi:MAG: ABC transporter ATP-binding protein [Pseudomonadota bacterium]